VTSSTSNSLHVSVDIGGTFTDCVVQSAGAISLFKAPTTPSDPVQGVLDVLAKAAGDEPIAAFLARVERFVHGTTLATNVLLTRTGARTGFVTTAGFRDVIEMRRGVRNLGTSMFNQFRPPYDPLVPRARRVGVPERVLFDGAVDQPLDEQATEDAVRRLVAQGCEAIAVGFLHAYANPVNEQHAKEIVQRVAPAAYVICSHEIEATIGEFERFSSTVISAFVGPSVSQYLSQLDARLREAGFAGSLLIMLSSGVMQTVDLAAQRAVEMLVSGPAAAPSAALAVAGPGGYRDVLEVDMGGTSFEVCVIRGGVVPTTKEAWIGEERIGTKIVDVGSIGAGGGSIAWIDSLGLLRVGPQSASADPGPAAYGRSDLPTVTDADLVLGLLPADWFLGGDLTLDVDRARAAVASVGEPLALDADAAATAIYDTVATSMANEVSEVCTKRGIDVRGFAMVAGGGAGGIHGASIAERLRIPTVLFPVAAPVLSAMGMLAMSIGQEAARAGIWDRLDVTAEALNETFHAIEDEQRASFTTMGVDLGEVTFARSLAMRYQGQFSELLIAAPAGDLDAAGREALVAAFHERYAELYGYSLAWRSVEILECHVRASAASGDDVLPTAANDAMPQPVDEALRGIRSVLIDGSRIDVPVYDRDRLRAGHAFAGPALVDSAASTIYVPSTFDARVDPNLTLVLDLRGATGNDHLELTEATAA
jgi:N-methylhydantoinase A